MSFVSRDIGGSIGVSPLQPIDAEDIPDQHPIRVLHSLYTELREACEGQHLPDFRELLRRMDRDLSEYCMVLSPVAADPFIDFIIIRKGSRIPGVELVSFGIGERYSSSIVPERLGARLMELASCLALKTPRLSSAFSARKSALNVKVFRGVFPVWDQSLLQHIVLLAIAPVYATLSVEPHARTPANTP